MGFLSRVFDDAKDRPAPPPEDDVPALQQQCAGLVLEINRSASDLPAVGVVLARAVTDELSLVLSSPEAYSMAIETRVQLHSVINDYVPATLRSYLRAARTARPDELGGARDALVGQLLTLRASVSGIADTTRRRDAVAQQVHGRFLEDRFGSSSELTL